MSPETQVETAVTSARPLAIPLGREDFEAAYARVAPHAHHTPLLSSHTLSERTGCEVRLKAELFQRTGSYKLRGPLNKLTYLTEEEKRRGVVCSSAGNHAQGLALAARIYGIQAVVVMAENATPSKIAATRGYGAEVVLHGTIWDEANEKAKELVRDRGLTYIHPFDDLQLIAGQGTVGLEIARDWPEVDVVVVPIGGGGLISGVSMAMKAWKPGVRIVGVESSGAPGMRDSVAAGHVVTLPKVDSVIDGLRVGRVGETTFQVVRRYVDEIVTLPDDEIFEAMLWLWSRAKLVVEGAAAAPVAALLKGLVRLPEGGKVACVLSGGNVNLDPIRGRVWN
jgi:threonine dehydratase